MSEQSKTVTPERVDLNSMDTTDYQRQRLKEIFPEAITEAGRIDFDKLRRTLGEAVEEGKERYGLNWAGKSDCIKTIQRPSSGTLVPFEDRSADFENTQNVIIEGDNLEVLKLLQKAYLNKVKVIYIDPPYNTGNDFIYPDDFSETLETYLRFTGQVDNEGRKYSNNLETDGRFHSKWLNMMYPRLFLARNLLREDGFIFVSIDDCEVANLKAVMNEIFGEENFVACIVWQKRTSPDARSILGPAHDYLLVYGRQVTTTKEMLRLLPLSESRKADYKNIDNDPRGPWASVDLTGQTGHATSAQYYEIELPNGNKIKPPEGRCWAIAESTFKKLQSENKIWFGKDGDARPRLKRFLSESEGTTCWTWWTNDEVGHNQEGTKEVNDLFDGADIFSNPKPTRLIRRILELTTSPKEGHLVLDFFSGSGTTGHAVLELNAEDDGNRKFILVQLPEPVTSGQYSSISDITTERIRRVIKRIETRSATPSLFNQTGRKLDLGYRFFRLQASNFKPWNSALPSEGTHLISQMELLIHNIRDVNLTSSILAELLLKSGFDLCAKCERISIAGSEVFSIQDGSLLVCLEKVISKELVNQMATLCPIRVICLDSGFAGNDQLKVNAVETFKAKGITFKTV